MLHGILSGSTLFPKVHGNEVHIEQFQALLGLAVKLSSLGYLTLLKSVSFIKEKSITGLDKQNS